LGGNAGTTTGGWRISTLNTRHDSQLNAVESVNRFHRFHPMNAMDSLSGVSPSATSLPRSLRLQKWFRRFPIRPERPAAADVRNWSGW
jgi:hypothetical protein